MKKAIRNIFGFVFGAGGALLMLGAVGGIELDTLSMTGGAIRAVIGLAAFVFGLSIAGAFKEADAR